MGRDLLSFPTKKALTPEGSHMRRDTQKEGRIYEPLEENAGRSREVSFCAWNARLAHSALSPSRCGSVTPSRFQRRDWSLLYEKLYILIYLLVTSIHLKSLLLFQCRSFLEAIDSQHCNCTTCSRAALLCGAHSTTIDGEIEIPTKGGNHAHSRRAPR